MRKTIALPDLHIPENIHLESTLKFIKDEKPDDLILLGDAMNINSLSHWAQTGGKKLTLENKRHFKECEKFSKFLDDLRLNTGDKCKITYLEGNHEDWINQYVDKHPEVQGLVELPNVLKLKDRGIDWIPYVSEKNFIKIGDVCYMHGEYVNDAHAKKTAINWGCHVRYAHTHDEQVYTASSKSRIKSPYQAKSIGCMCKAGKYMKGRPNKWIEAFNIAYFENNKLLDDYTIQIRNNKFFFNNKLYGR